MHRSHVSGRVLARGSAAYFLINYNLYFNCKTLRKQAEMNGAKEYRIKNTKQSMPKMHGSVLTAVSVQKGKQPVKYSDLIQLEKKDALLHTLIEEHMIKFGYVNAFDTLARELQEKESKPIIPAKQAPIVVKTSQSLRLTDIKQEIACG